MNNKDVIIEDQYGQYQQGPLSDRVYLMKVKDTSKAQETLNVVDNLARKNNRSKGFGKITESMKTTFETNNYQIEASVPGLFCGSEDGHFVGKYFDEKRRILSDSLLISQVKETAIKKKNSSSEEMTTRFSPIKVLSKSDSYEIASLYKKTFESYPFPIFDPSFISDNMDNDVTYYGIYDHHRLISVSSAEKDPKNLNAEMSDFSTLPEYRKNGLATKLLIKMTNDLRELGYFTCFTIARAESFGMNITFAKAGYSFSGTLPNNTNIGGKIESMNVWYKNLK